MGTVERDTWGQYDDTLISEKMASVDRIANVKRQPLIFLRFRYYNCDLADPFSAARESMAAPRPMSRRRPLHTCAASMLAIVHTACRMTQELNGPIGTFTRRITRFASAAFPIVNAMQYQCLAILSFSDDCMLSLERIVETVFPPSTCLFDKIDELVYTAEVMPEKLVKALNTFPNFMHHVPFLDWVVMHLIWWLNFLLSSLTHWGSKNMKEKDIMIDTNCSNCSTVTESADQENCPGKESTSISCPSQENTLDSGKAEGDVPISWPSQENKLVSGKAESDVDLLALAESGNKEKIVPVLNSLEDGKETVGNAECTEESSSSDSISAPMGEFSVLVEFSSMSEHIHKEELLPVLASFQDESRLVYQAEAPVAAEHKNEEELLPPVDSLEDETNSVNYVDCPVVHQSEKPEIKPVGDAELPSCAKCKNKEGILPVSELLEDETATDKTVECPPGSSSPATSDNLTSLGMGDLLEDKSKSVSVTLEPDVVAVSHKKEMLEKGTKENAQVKADIAQSTVDKERSSIERKKEINKNEKEVSLPDPILELFEARWHM